VNGIPVPVLQAFAVEDRRDFRTGVVIQQLVDFFYYAVGVS